MYQDKTLNCRECGRDFIFSASEQEFYAEKGLKTSLPVVRNAGLQGKLPTGEDAAMVGIGRCISRYVQSAVR